jgi:hypothetical protein
MGRRFVFMAKSENARFAKEFFKKFLTRNKEEDP